MDNGFKVQKGVSFKPQTSQPANGVDGDIYYDSAMGGFQQYSNGSWGPLGSGGGSGGINMIGMNSSFQPVNINDINADGTIGNWAAYADAAGTQPVDMTGGSPTTAISRTTTAGEVLNGLGSFKVVKGAANYQGEGVSVITTIPTGYRGRSAVIDIPVKLISGNLAEGDLKVFIYDVTNSMVIIPQNNDFVTGHNAIKAYFDLPSTCVQLRVGFHFASTSATAVTFSFDDVFVGVQDVAFGPAMSDWQDGSTSFGLTGFGSPTNVSIKYRRVGDTLEVLGYGLSTTVSSPEYITLPPSLATDVSKLATGTGQHALGTFTRLNAGGSTNISTTDGINFLAYDPTNPNRAYVSYKAGSGVFDITAGSLGNGDGFAFQYKVPIQGWSTNMAIGNSSTFNVSALIANGTRVTAPPAKLGEYRSMYRASGSSSTLSDTAPSSPPTIADGMAMTATLFASAGTAGVITRYEIFIGKNKNFKVLGYAFAGKTGFLDVVPWVITSGGTNVYTGLKTAYDPTIGILIVDASAEDTSIQASDRFVGGLLTEGTAGSLQHVNSGYFDVVVSENVLPVQLGSKQVIISPEASISAGGSGTISNFDLTINGVKANTILEVSVQPNINSIGATRSAGSGGGSTVDHHTYFTLYRGINGASPTAIAQFSIHRLDNTVGEYEMVPSSVIRYLDVYPTPGDIRYYFTVTSDNGVTLNWLEPSIMIVREV